MDLTRSRPELILENMLLRQQLIMLKRQAKRLALTWRDRMLFVLLASKLRTWKQALLIVQPDTVLRWHRDLFRWVWRRKSRPRRRGKPPLTDDIVSLIKRMAKENRTLVTGRDPRGLAAAAIYIASILTDHRVTQRDIAMAAGVTEVTVRNRYKELVQKLQITMAP